MAHLTLDAETLAALRTERTQVEFYDSSFQATGSFGVRVGRGGRKAFFLIYQIGGRRKRMTLGAYPILTLEDARKQALDILRDVASAGRDPAAERRRFGREDRFTEVCRAFLTEQGERFAPSTRREYQRIIDRELLPAFGDRTVRSITATDAKRLLESISRERTADVMANRTRALLSRLFSYARARGLCDENPVRETAAKRTAPRSYRVFSSEELKLLWRALEEESEQTRSIFRLLLLTGQRLHEVLRMRWQEISFESWNVTSKKGRTREVHLSPAAISILRNLRGINAHPEFVFAAASKPSNHLASPRRAVLRIQARMGIRKRWSPSDLRTTVEYHLAQLKIRPDIIQHILDRRYTLPRSRFGSYDYRPEARAALNQWAQHLIATVGTPPPTSLKVIPLFRK